MKGKMWDVMDEYIWSAGTVEIFEKEVINALVELFQREGRYSDTFKYEWDTYPTPRGTNATGMCVFSWVTADGHLDHEAFYYV